MKFPKPRQGELQLNMTSMLDVVFLLIIFFILVTNFSAADLPPLKPPNPKDSKAQKEENTVTRLVNVVPVMRKVVKDGRQREEMIGVADHLVAYGENIPLGGAGLQRLTDLLTRERQRRDEEDKQMIVDLRVHRSIPFKDVQPVMRAVAKAKVKSVNLVALVNTNSVD